MSGAMDWVKGVAAAGGWIAAVACGGLAPVSAGEFDSPRLSAVTSWVGNSYGGAAKWVQQDIRAMTVMPDGTLFTNVPWDEAGGNVGEYRGGALIRYAGHTHGWGNNGGEAVAANSRHLFIGVAVGNEGGGLQDPASWPPKGKKWLGVSRRARADITQGVPFAGGKGGKGDTLKECLLVVAEVADDARDDLPGLAADEKNLYVADPQAAEIKVYDAATMQLQTHWKVRQAGPLAVDDAGTLWMLERSSGSTPSRLVRFRAADGEPLPELVLPADLTAATFCLAPDGRVLVADDGPAQQIRILKPAPGGLAEAGRFGEKGGIAAGVAGAFGDRKLNRVAALGCDARGNLYLAHDGQSGGGGTVLESYSLESEKLNWRLLGLTFVDMGEIDAADDRQLFTKEERFQLDYAKGPGSETAYRAFTLDRLKYPQDPRLHLWSAGAWVRTIGGRRLLFVHDMNAEHLQVYRFTAATDGEVAIPCGFFASGHLKEKEGWPAHQPERGEWIWRDLDGQGDFDEGEFLTPEAGGKDSPRAQGWWVDARGNVWRATETSGLRYFPLQGFDDHDCPRWDYAGMRVFPPPEGFREIKRLRYDCATDTLYLGGTTAEAVNQHWKPMGPVLARYDRWLAGEGTPRWRVTLPYARGSSGHESCEPMGFDAAGDFLFVPYTGASKKEEVKTGRVEIFRQSDGSAIGHLEPGEEVGEVGLQDIRETLTAYRRPDGEYLILMEDDFKSKILMYRLRLLSPP